LSKNNNLQALFLQKKQSANIRFIFDKCKTEFENHLFVEFVLFRFKFTDNDFSDALGNPSRPFHPCSTIILRAYAGGEIITFGTHL